MRWSPPREALPSTRVERDDWQTLRTLLPYLWAYRGRVLFALACLVAAKLATVSVPILLKDIVDRLSPAAQSAARHTGRAGGAGRRLRPACGCRHRSSPNCANSSSST